MENNITQLTKDICTLLELIPIEVFERLSPEQQKELQRIRIQNMHREITLDIDNETSLHLTV